MKNNYFLKNINEEEEYHFTLLQISLMSDLSEDTRLLISAYTFSLL